MRKKRAMTLLEIMIVILIIGTIGSVLGYNMRGSLEQAKAFKTEEGIRQLYDIFQLELAKGTTVQEIKENPRNCLIASGLVRKPDDLIKDGWNVEYTIVQTPDGKDVRITSDSYTAYCNNKRKVAVYPWDQQ